MIPSYSLSKSMWQSGNGGGVASVALTVGGNSLGGRFSGSVREEREVLHAVWF